MMIVYPRFSALFFRVLWTISVLYILDFAVELVRTVHSINPCKKSIGFPINSTQDLTHNHGYSTNHSDTKTDIERRPQYSRDYLLSFENKPPGTESNVDCGISEHLCTHLASLNLLNHSCPFHVPLLPQKPTQTKSKRWKKRGKGRKKQAHNDIW